MPLRYHKALKAVWSADRLLVVLQFLILLLLLMLLLMMLPEKQLREKSGKECK